MAGIRPGKYNPLKPDIELFDYKSKKRYGLKLDGSGALQVGTVSQDDTVHISSAGKKLGDFDEQRSWKAGRGIENLSTNATGFWDSKDAWTMTDEHVHQGLLWQFARGIRAAIVSMPDKTHSVSFTSLLGAKRYLDTSFTADESVTASYLRMWIRRVGNPGTLTVKVYTDSVHYPNTLLSSSTITASDVSDVVSVLKKFTLSGSTSITSGTKYHVVIYGSSTDDKNNRWEIGGDVNATGDIYYSVDGSTWIASSFSPYYYIPSADIKRTFYSFSLDGVMYVVDSKDDLLTASQIWVNGDRGVATSGSGTSLVASKSWTTDRWAGAFVRIVRGTGVGQVREIASNTATTLTLTSAWDRALDTSSEFAIYGTNWWTEITSAGFNVVRSAPVVANRVVYFPQGGNSTRMMIFNATTAAHSFSNDSNSGIYVMAVSSDAAGTKVWCFSDQAKYAVAPAYSTTPSTLTLSSVTVGNDGTMVTGAVEKDGSMYVFKSDGIWTITLSNVTSTVSVLVVKLQNGMEKTPSAYNGKAVITHQQFVYYSWLFSLIRVYGSSHDDVGQDWSGKGLPDSREGAFASLDSYTSLLIGGVDAREGTSSVLGFDGLGWHELYRAYDENYRIRFVKVQPCEGTRNRMWVDVGGDLISQEMPYQKSSPNLDSGIRYVHEAVIESSTIDMGTASGLPKFIKELTVYANNLGENAEIRIDYQVDDDVHTDNWTEATVLYESPESTAFLGLSNIRKFAYRLRILSSDNTKPVDILGVVPNGYARVPYKMVWTLRCRADNISSRGRIVKPDELMRWLLDSARYPGRVEMRSQYELAHRFFVIIHPPRMFPYKPAQNGQAEESVFTIVLEES